MAPKVRVSGTPYMPTLVMPLNKKSVRLNGTAMLRVEAPQGVTRGLPVDLVAVLDVSGSMGGAAAPPAKEESRLDLLKKAMKFVISQLGDKDRLAIVAFNEKIVNEHTTEFFEISGSGRISAEKKVEKLVAKGDTAFKPALEHAVKILDSRGDKSRVGFILLLSDGLDNSKFKWEDDVIASTDPVRSLLAKYPVHTFGLCKAHDPEALLFMAKESKGTYSSITDNLNSRTMESFAIFLGGLKTVVAINVSVDIKVNMEYTVWKTKITRIDSGGYKNSISSDGKSGKIVVGILCAGEVKDFIVYYEFDSGEKTEEKTKAYNYHPFNGIGQYEDFLPGGKSISTDRFSLLDSIYALSCSNSLRKDLLPCAKVLRQILRFSIIKLLIAFLGEFRALKKKAQGAMDRDKGDSPVLQTIAGNMLQSRWEAFKKSDEFWKEAERIGLELGGMNKDIAAMVSNMKRALGVACVYSWVSSYQMQRAAITGLPSTGFLTNSMEAMMETATKKVVEEAASSNKGKTQPAPMVGEESSKCKIAFELLAGIDKRLELWFKLEQGTVPPTHPAPALGTEGTVAGAMHQDIYQAAVQAINNWRISEGKQPHAATGSDKNAHEALHGSHTKQ